MVSVECSMLNERDRPASSPIQHSTFNIEHSTFVVQGETRDADWNGTLFRRTANSTRSDLRLPFRGSLMHSRRHLRARRGEVHLDPLFFVDAFDLRFVGVDDDVVVDT